MPTREHVQQLLVELGPYLELAEIHEAEDGAAWLLAVDDETVVLAQFDEARGRLILTLDVGEPPESRRPRLLELLLSYNAEWARTGGVTMSLDEPGGRVLQSLELTATDLELARLATAFVAFLDIGRGWTEVVTREPTVKGEFGADEGGVEETAPPDDQPPLGSVRV